jgi:hypothetical protein
MDVRSPHLEPLARLLPCLTPGAQAAVGSCAASHQAPRPLPLPLSPPCLQLQRKIGKTKKTQVWYNK